MFGNMGWVFGEFGGVLRERMQVRVGVDVHSRPARVGWRCGRV
jgi:hypothetical protein